MKSQESEVYSTCGWKAKTASMQTSHVHLALRLSWCMGDGRLLRSRGCLLMHQRERSHQHMQHTLQTQPSRPSQTTKVTKIQNAKIHLSALFEPRLPYPEETGRTPQAGLDELGTAWLRVRRPEETEYERNCTVRKATTTMTTASAYSGRISLTSRHKPL